MIVVTGGAGFIGSNVVHVLNREGRSDIVVVDDLTRSEKYSNLAGAEIADYADKRRFLELLAERAAWVPQVEAVVHQGACTSTTHPDGRYVVENNYEYSRRVLDYCVASSVPLIYASSAAVYGAGPGFTEHPVDERPLNVYGFSKLLFDREVRRHLPTASSQIVGLRYFNVFGAGEAHKGDMRSAVTKFDAELRADGRIRVFGEGEGRAAGQHRRDFVWVRDVVDVIGWFIEHPDRSGVFNCGTGEARTFDEVAHEVIMVRGGGTVEYVDFPTELSGRYQSFTRADLRALRSVGYDREFTSLGPAIRSYLGAGSTGE